MSEQKPTTPAARHWVLTIHSPTGSVPVEYVEDSPGSNTWHLLEPEKWRVSPPIDKEVLRLTAPVSVTIEGSYYPGSGESLTSMGQMVGLNHTTAIPADLSPPPGG